MSPANQASSSHSATSRPAWLLPMIIGVGAAATVALLGSLLLAITWFLTTDRTANSTDDVQIPVVTADLNRDHAAVNKTPPVQIAAVPTAASATTDDAATKTPSREQQVNLEPIRLDAVPLIGGAPPVTSIAPLEPTPQEGAEEPKQEVPEKLDLPFLVLGCASSTDGRHVVAWGYDWQNTEVPLDAARVGDQRPAESRLALLELATRKILATRAIAAVVTQVDLNATGVYVTANEDPAKQEMSVLRLSVSDLQSLDRATILLGTITSIADQILVSERPENGGSRKYILPGLQPVDPDAAPISMRTRSTPALRLADGWLLDGVLWDHDMNTPLLLSSLTDFQPVATNLSRSSGIIAVPILQGCVTHMPSGTPPSPRDWRLERPRFSPHVPAVLAFNNLQGKTSLEFLEHNTGKVLRSVVLTSGTPRNVRLVTTPQWIIVTLDGNAFLLPTQSKQAPIDVPFRLEPRQSTLVLSAGTPVQVRYQAQAATKFELEIPALIKDGVGLRQQSPTGEFTIDPAAAVPVIVKAMHASTSNDRRAFQGDIAAWADSYVERLRARFVRLTGREPEGVPLVLDAYVRAYGKDLSLAVLHHVYLIEVPREEFEQYRRPAATPLAARQTPPPPPAAPQPPLQPQPTPQPTPQASVPSEALRTWTDNQGRTMQAKFVQLDGEVVVVVDQRQRTLRIPLDRLSEQDRVWAAEQAATRDQAPGDEP